MRRGGLVAVDAELLGGMVARHMAMIPTLKMFATTVTTNPAYLEPIYAEVRQFHALGGELLFGTDVGYMTDYRTEDEFRALAQCGLNARDILRMLTTAPAGRFGVDGQKGSIAPGKLADLVVLSGDPGARHHGLCARALHGTERPPGIRAMTPPRARASAVRFIVCLGLVSLSPI